LIWISSVRTVLNAWASASRLRCALASRARSNHA
jgi:hypothetical protein